MTKIQIKYNNGRASETRIVEYFSLYPHSNEHSGPMLLLVDPSGSSVTLDLTIIENICLVRE